MHTIEYDAASNILNVRLAGQWTQAEFDAFETEFLTMAKKLESEGGTAGLLSDSRDFLVQSPDIAKQFEALPGKTRHAFKATAIVAGSVLNKMQANRTLVSDHLQIFMDVAEARDWLRSALSPDAAAA